MTTKLNKLYYYYYLSIAFRYIFVGPEIAPPTFWVLETPLLEFTWKHTIDKTEKKDWLTVCNVRRVGKNRPGNRQCCVSGPTHGEQGTSGCWMQVRSISLDKYSKYSLVFLVQALFRVTSGCAQIKN